MSSSKAMTTAGWALTGLLSLFLAFVASVEISNSPDVQAGFASMGYHGSVMPIGLALLLSVIFYTYPRTTVLGSILLTGYMGGAVLAHLMMNQASLTPVPVVFGVLIWAGAWLRMKSLRDLIPVTKK